MPFTSSVFKIYLKCIYGTTVSNLGRHSAKADVIADMKSKIILSRWQFCTDVIFSATSKVQNYQNKIEEKFLYSNKCMLATYFREF